MASSDTHAEAGQMTENALLSPWLKQEGDVVRKGDVLLRDRNRQVQHGPSKPSTRAWLVEARRSGRETVPVQRGLCYVGEPGEAIPTSPAPVGRQAPAAASPQPVAPVAVAPAPAVTSAPLPRRP